MIFQRDYWKMGDQEILQLAAKCNIQPWKEQKMGSVAWTVTDRDSIITILVNRDTALRTNWAIVVSLVSLALSVTSLLVR